MSTISHLLRGQMSSRQSLGEQMSSYTIFHRGADVLCINVSLHFAMYQCCLHSAMNQCCLYPRHLCRGVYSFCLSVRLFVHSYVRLFVLPSRSWNLRQSFASKFLKWCISQQLYPTK